MEPGLIYPKRLIDPSLQTYLDPRTKKKSMRHIPALHIDCWARRPRHPVASSATVLVVEDDRSARKLACNILGRRVYQVSESEGGCT